MIEVSRGTTSDIEWILPELKRFSEFYGTRKQLYSDDEQARSLIEVFINRHVLFVARDGAAPCGFIGGFKTPHLLNPTINVLCESFWWVLEHYRGSKAGAKLLDKFVEYGKINSDWITFALERNTPISDKPLLKRGFQQMETNYILEVQ
jgi:hypothetical protein